MARSLIGLGDTTSALQRLRMVLDAEHDDPSYQTQAWLTFAWVVAERRLADAYGEALDIVEKVMNAPDFASRVVFPREVYQLNASLAGIHEDLGRPEAARRFAQAALEASEEQHSGFRYQPTMGLVEDTSTPLHERLKQICGI